MKLIKVAAAVLNQTPLDWEGNRRNIVAAITDARRQGAKLLCLPELCISGYGCEDAFHGPWTAEMSLQVLKEILPETHGMIVSFGLPLRHQNSVFNSACLVVDGKIRGFVAKRFLAGDGIHYEPRWFKPWPPGIQNSVEVEDTEYPLGDIHFDCGGIKIGFEICEDAWVANRPGAGLALKGVDIILNPSASHFAFGKIDVRKRFVLEGSRAFGVSYIYANLVGNESGRAIYDGGALIASAGKLIAEGKRFLFADSAVTAAVIDVDQSRMSQARTASFKPDLHEDHEDCVEIEFNWPEVEPVAPDLHPDPWESGKFVKEEEFCRATSLALFDYLRKSRSGGYVVSLSGGADSAAITVLVSMAVHIGVDQLGLEGFLAKLSYLGRVQQAGTKEEILKVLLTCVYQSTKNSSTVTREAARVVAAASGAVFLEFDIDQLVSDYVRMVSKGIGRELSWERDDIALQNIQARVRSPGVWLLANLTNSLLLSTSNRSEAAVGYATMDGDTSGGLSPIAGIDKAFLRQWLRWMEEHGPEGMFAVPALRSVNVQAPTAELRPLETKQTDEEDLMPYPLLDAIERAAIRDKQNPTEVFLLMKTRFPQYSQDQLVVWIERFFRLWSRNQWKRERYAPSFHVDDQNLDPKTWCRFPILSGGFERELRQLREFVEKRKAART